MDRKDPKERHIQGAPVRYPNCQSTMVNKIPSSGGRRSGHRSAGWSKIGTVLSAGVREFGRKCRHANTELLDDGRTGDTLTTIFPGMDARTQLPRPTVQAAASFESHLLSGARFECLGCEIAGYGEPYTLRTKRGGSRSMGVVQGLSVLALQPLVEGACIACGLPSGLTQVAKDDTGPVVNFLVKKLTEHFTDHTKRLPKAISKANENAWKTLRVALAGDSLWDRIRVLVSSSDAKAFRRVTQSYLDTLHLPADKAAFCKRCLKELDAAERTGILSGRVDPTELGRQTGSFAQFADPVSVLEAEWRVVDEMAAVLEHEGHESLAFLVRLRPDEGSSLLAIAVRYFFQREIEKDDALHKQLSWATWQTIAVEQQQGFNALSTVLTDHGAVLDEILGEVTETGVNVRAIRKDVLDLKTVLAEHSRFLGEIPKVIIEAVMEVLQQFQLNHRGMNASDSIALHERMSARERAIEVLEQFDALRVGQQLSVPALWDAIGKLEMMVRKFDRAQVHFRLVASIVSDPEAQAQARYNAYQAALEQRQWPEALEEIREVARLAPERFTDALDFVERREAPSTDASGQASSRVHLDMAGILKEASYATDISATGDGVWLATMHQNRRIHLWGMDDLSQHVVIAPRNSDGYLTSCALRPVCGGWEIVVGLSNAFERWIVRENLDAEWTGGANFQQLIKTQFSSDGSLLLVATKSGVMDLREADSWKQARRFRCPEAISCASFCGGDRFVVAGSDTGKTFLWDLSSRELETRDDHGGQPVCSVAGLASRPVYMSAGEGGLLVVRKFGENEVLQQTHLGAPIFCATWDKGEGLIWAGMEDGGLVAQDMLTGAECWRLSVGESPSALAAVGRLFLAGANYDRTIGMRETRTGKELATLIGFGANDWLALSRNGNLTGAGYDRFVDVGNEVNTHRLEHPFGLGSVVRSTKGD